MENYDDFSLVVMEKNALGVLEKELGMYRIQENKELIVKAYAERGKNDILCLHLLLKADKELNDDEFEKCYDYYDKTEKFEHLGIEVSEIEDCFYPTWDFSLPFDDAKMESAINNIIALHKQELDEVYALMIETGGAG